MGQQRTRADDETRKDCEVFDLVKRTWEALPEVAITLGNAVGCTGGERDSLRSEE